MNQCRRIFGVLKQRFLMFEALALVCAIVLSSASHRARADSSDCGGQLIVLPFTDVISSTFFCQIAAAYFSGLTNGTSPTTYTPSANVTREQMAAFTTRTQDAALRRGSRRAALNFRWTPSSISRMGVTALFDSSGASDLPNRIQPDGADLWVSAERTLLRVRASDGVVLSRWPLAAPGRGVLVAIGSVFVVSRPSSTGAYLYRLDPSVGLHNFTLPGPAIRPDGIAFDGNRIWIGSEAGTIFLVTPPAPNVLYRWTIVTSGFSQPRGLVYDGTNMWATDFGAGKLFKLDSDAGILLTVTVENNPLFPAFDGTNIWVPNYGSNSVTVVRAATGAVLATLTGNGLVSPSAAAFDGERVLIANEAAGSVSLFRATDLSPLGSISLGAGSNPVGVASDGINFWIALRSNGTGTLVRF